MQPQPAPQAMQGSAQPYYPQAPQQAQPYYPQQPQQAQAQPYYPPQQQPQQPYPQQPYPQQPYPPPQPQYVQPYGYAPPPPQPLPPPSGHSHFHDGEVIANFAVVGVLASTDILVRQDVTNGNAVTFVTLAGLAGGGGVGYLLTQKFPVDASTAHATTIGTMVGIANGALLIEPINKNPEATTVMSLLLGGSAIGAAGGFLYGETAKLTPAQSMFVGNMALIGSATGALAAIAHAGNNGSYGAFENGSLLVGLDGAVVIGALVAPHLDWSPRREKYVFASSFVGALAGLLIGGLAAKPSNGGVSNTSATVVTSTMTAGLWGGFGLGVILTHDSAPDPSFIKPAAATPGTQPATPGMPTSAMPWVGDHGQFGMMVGGAF